MSRSPAYDDDREYAIDQKPLAAVDPDMQQAMYFKALLDERHAQILHEIWDKTTALAQSRAGNGTSAMRRLRQGLAAAQREQADLDRLRNSLRVHLTADVPETAEVIRPFDIVIARRRPGWRIEIPELGIVLTNVDSRTDAEAVSRSIIAAIADYRLLRSGRDPDWRGGRAVDLNSDPKYVNDDAVPLPVVVVGRS
jgi:hypothetical protein